MKAQQSFDTFIIKNTFKTTWPVKHVSSHNLGSLRKDECVDVAIGFAGFQQRASYIVIERQIDRYPWHPVWPAWYQGNETKAYHTDACYLWISIVITSIIKLSFNIWRSYSVFVTVCSQSFCNIVYRCFLANAKLLWIYISYQLISNISCCEFNNCIISSLDSLFSILI